MLVKLYYLVFKVSLLSSPSLVLCLSLTTIFRSALCTKYMRKAAWGYFWSWFQKFYSMAGWPCYSRSVHDGVRACGREACSQPLVELLVWRLHWTSAIVCAPSKFLRGPVAAALQTTLRSIALRF